MKATDKKAYLITICYFGRMNEQYTVCSPFDLGIL